MNNAVFSEYEPWLAHDPRVYLRHTARARELQSEALGQVIGQSLGSTARLVARIGADAYRRLAGWVRTRYTIAQLSRLDDHMLADIGIDREQIPLIAEGLIAPSGEAPRRTVPAAPCPSEYREGAANDTKPSSIAA